jgi:pyruvate/2-oxoglutarate dehydrogenase complex dihydrolipoamide acyltransferase (E2) component
MPRTFRPLEGLSSWRRLAPHVWDRPRDPTVYGVMELVVDRALPYLEALSQRSGVKIRLSHLVTKALATAIRDNPAANGIISHRRIQVRSTVDIFVQVATDKGRDLSGAKIARVDEKGLVEIARELAERAERVRRHADPGVERTKGLVERLPNFLLGRTIRLMEYLIYDLQLDLSRFGLARDQFGSAMVSNIGNFEGFGMSFALAPLVPISRVPIVVLFGEVQRKPVVEGDRIVARSVVALGCTFDHRMIDGAQGTSMAAVIRRVLEDPEQAFGPIDEVPMSGNGEQPAALDRVAAR